MFFVAFAVSLTAAIAAVLVLFGLEDVNPALAQPSAAAQGRNRDGLRRENEKDTLRLSMDGAGRWVGPESETYSGLVR